MSFCKHGIDPEQVTCQQCEVEHAKSWVHLNPHTRASEMTLREAFAMSAMEGLLANHETPLDSEGREVREPEQIRQIIAECAVDYADALIAELAKPVKP